MYTENESVPYHIVRGDQCLEVISVEYVYIGSEVVLSLDELQLGVEGSIHLTKLSVAFLLDLVNLAFVLYMR